MNSRAPHQNNTLGYQLFESNLEAQVPQFSLSPARLKLCGPQEEWSKPADCKVYYDGRFELRLNLTLPKNCLGKMLDDRHVDIEVGGLKKLNLRCLTTRHSLSSVGGSDLELFPRTLPVDLGSHENIFRATGVIICGPNMLIPTQRSLVFSCDGISIAINTFKHTDAIYLERRNFIGKNAVTHWFELGKLDSSRLTLAQLNEAVSILRDFLSFVGGSRIEIAHVSGYDEFGAIVFLQLGSTKYNSMGTNKNWFDLHLTNTLPTLFERFSTAYQVPQKNLTIRRTIEYYSLANHIRETSIEAALLMSYAGLETLADIVLKENPNERQSRSKKKTDLLRQAARILGLQSDPAESLSELQRVIADRKLEDGYHAIKEFRNSVTHSEKFNYTGLELHQAWVASQWLFETLFALWFGYDGDFSDRRSKKWVGERVKITDYLNNPTPAHP